MVLRVPSLRPNTGYAVLYTDEAGVSRWILPDPPAEGGGEATRGGAGEVTFRLPRDAAPRLPADTDETVGSRGPVSILGRRLVRVLVWATDEVVGHFGLQAVRTWEEEHRPYQLLRVGPDGPLADVAPNAADWARLTTGPALLLLHGTFSSAQGTFGDLWGTPRFVTLVQQYGGRVLAFNHPSLYHNPAENVQVLLASMAGQLPAGQSLTLDVLTHSRGGLVGRELAERVGDMDAHGLRVDVRRGVLVASPNRGTILADGDNWIDLADRYTNFITALPDTTFTLIMEGILTFVKVMGHGMLAGLPGLSCLVPKGDYLLRLNDTALPPTTYYTLGASFTPQDPGLVARLCKKVGDKVVDTIFGEANDGVVPAEGTYSTGLAGAHFQVPAERHRVYALEDQMHHCNYFEHDVVVRQVEEWLAG